MVGVRFRRLAAADNMREKRLLMRKSAHAVLRAAFLGRDVSVSGRDAVD